MEFGMLRAAGGVGPYNFPGKFTEHRPVRNDIFYDSFPLDFSLLKC